MKAETAAAEVSQLKLIGVPGAMQPESIRFETAAARWPLHMMHEVSYGPHVDAPPTAATKSELPMQDPA